MPNEFEIKKFEIKELLRSQVGHSDPEQLLKLLQSKDSIKLEDLTKLDAYGNSALHFALLMLAQDRDRDKSYELFEFLIKNYPELLSVKNKAGSTPYTIFFNKIFSTRKHSLLERALDNEKIKLLKCLLDRPDLISKSSLYNLAVFHALLIHNENDLLKKVIGLAIDASEEAIISTLTEDWWYSGERGSYGLRNFISVAAKQGNLPIVKFLLENDVNPNVYESAHYYGVDGSISEPLLQLVMKAISYTNDVDKKNLCAIRNSLIAAMFIERDLCKEKLELEFERYTLKTLQRIWVGLIEMPCAEANEQNRGNVEKCFRDYLYEARPSRGVLTRAAKSRESDPDLYKAYLLLKEENLFAKTAYNFNLGLYAYIQYLKKGSGAYAKIENVIEKRKFEFLKESPELVASFFLYYRQKGEKQLLNFFRQMTKKDISGLQDYVACFDAFRDYQDAIHKPIEGANEISIQNREKFDASIEALKASAKNGLGLASFLLSEIFACNFVMVKENEDGYVIPGENAEVEIDVVMPADPINVFLYALMSARKKVVAESSVTFKDSLLLPYGSENLEQLLFDDKLKATFVASFCAGERLDQLFDVFGPVSITENEDKTYTLVFSKVLRGRDLSFTVNSEQRECILQSFSAVLSRFTPLGAKDNALFSKIKSTIDQLALGKEATVQVQAEVVADKPSNPAPVQVEASLDQIPKIDAPFLEEKRLGNLAAEDPHVASEEEVLLLKEKEVAIYPNDSVPTGPTLLNIPDEQLSPSEQVEKYALERAEYQQFYAENEKHLRDIFQEVSVGSSIKGKKKDTKVQAGKDKDRVVEYKFSLASFFKLTDELTDKLLNNCPEVPTDKPIIEKSYEDIQRTRVAQRV